MANQSILSNFVSWRWRIRFRVVQIRSTRSLYFPRDQEPNFRIPPITLPPPSQSLPTHRSCSSAPGRGKVREDFEGTYSTIQRSGTVADRMTWSNCSFVMEFRACHTPHGERAIGLIFLPITFSTSIARIHSMALARRSFSTGVKDLAASNSDSPVTHRSHDSPISQRKTDFGK